jgi:hypothetical protein
MTSLGGRLDGLVALITGAARNDGWQRALDVNLPGVWNTCRAAPLHVRLEGAGRRQPDGRAFAHELDGEHDELPTATWIEPQRAASNAESLAHDERGAAVVRRALARGRVVWVGRRFAPRVSLAAGGCYIVRPGPEEAS